MTEMFHTGRGLITFTHARWKDLTNMFVPVYVRRFLLVAGDVASCVLAFLMFAWLRYKNSLTDEQWISGCIYTAIAVQVVGVLATQVHLGRGRIGRLAKGSSQGASFVLIAVGGSWRSVAPGFASTRVAWDRRR